MEHDREGVRLVPLIAWFVATAVCAAAAATGPGEQPRSFVWVEPFAPAGSAAPAPTPHNGLQSPGELLLFQMFAPTPRVMKRAEELGFEPVPLITKSRFYDAEADRVDPIEYQQKIWTPDDDPLPGLGSWEKFGIPPGWRVWADLDYEQWEEIFHPEDYTDQEVIARLRDYKKLIDATRVLRPEALVCIHGIVRGELIGQSGMLIEEIVSLCDAVSPSLANNFDRDLTNVEQQFDIKRERLEACLELKKQYGVKVLPLVSKRYRINGPDGPVKDEEGRRIILLTPPHILKAMMELIFTTEVDGLKVDGVIVWGNDNRVLRADGEAHFAIPDTPDQRTADKTDIRFLEIIDEAARMFWYEPVPADGPGG